MLKINLNKKIFYYNKNLIFESDREKFSYNTKENNI